MAVGGAGTESRLPWQHLQCTGVIVYLPLRGLANGGTLMGQLLMFPDQRTDWQLAEPEARRRWDVVGWMRWETSGWSRCHVMPPPFTSTKQSLNIFQNTALDKTHFWTLKNRESLCHLKLEPCSQMKHTHNPKCIQSRGSANKPDTWGIFPRPPADWGRPWAWWSAGSLSLPCCWTRRLGVTSRPFLPPHLQPPPSFTLIPLFPLLL